jgi:hypothetical protein
MLVDNRGKEPVLICEHCGRPVAWPKHLSVVEVWRAHALVCTAGCPKPSSKTTHLRVTRLALV